MDKKSKKRWGAIIVVLCILNVCAIFLIVDGVRDGLFGESAGTEGMVEVTESSTESGPEADITDETRGQETEESTEAETEEETEPETEGTYTVTIPVLNRTLEVPESKFVYWIDGIYLDWNRNFVPLECTEWMIVSDQEYDEAELSRLLREEPEETAKHILYCLEIVEDRDLFPLTKLLLPVYSAKDTCDTGDGVVRRISPENVQSAEGFGASPRIEDYPSEAELDEMIPYQQWNRSLFRYAPKLVYLQDGINDTYFVPYFLEYSHTVIDDDWWGSYSEALAQLKTLPETYQYNNAEKALLSLLVEKRYQQYCADGSREDKSEMVRAYIDQELEIHLRAAAYAHFVANKGGDKAQAPQLEDIAIVFQEWDEGQRSYAVYVRDGSTEAYELSFTGYDYWSGGFDVLREYLRGMYPEMAEVTQPESEVISVDGMPIDDYLATYGLEQYESEYLTLNPVENVLYVPFANGIEIYYAKMLIGCISINNMRQAGWVNDQRYTTSLFGGARTIYEELEVETEFDSPYLAILVRRKDPLFGATEAEWLAAKDPYITANEVLEMNTLTYEIFYGNETDKYGYWMRLSTYMINQDILGQLISAVNLNEQSFTEEAYQKMSTPGKITGNPDTVISNAEIKWSDADTGLDGQFHIPAGDDVYMVPEGTVAIVEGDGWGLYAYIGYHLSKIGTIERHTVSEDKQLLVTEYYLAGETHLQEMEFELEH